MKYRFAILGCGAVSQKHMQALGRIEDASVTAGCDISENTAKSFGEKYGLPYFTDPHKMMAEKGDEIDIITVLTPSGLHGRNIIDLARYGKHFLVEKPLALRLDETDELLEACDRFGGKIFVVKQNRFNRPIVKLKEAVVAGRFGKLVMATVRVRWCRKQEYYSANKWRGTWAMDGGVLTNQASHHIDMLMWLMGDVESVQCQTSTRLANIEAEDTAAAILRFSNGALGIIEATTATRPRDYEGSVSVMGEKGIVEVGGFAMNKLKTWDFDPAIDDDKEVFEKWGENPNEPAWNHAEYIRSLVGHLNDGRLGVVDGLQGRKSLELINAMYESAETGQQVALRFRPKMCKLGISQE